eukprot:scaffold3364_cov186-Alexandrium_tamarense.AAC.24
MNHSRKAEEGQVRERKRQAGVYRATTYDRHEETPHPPVGSLFSNHRFQTKKRVRRLSRAHNSTINCQYEEHNSITPNDIPSH